MIEQKIVREKLYDRIRERTNPAKKMLTMRNRGVDLGEIILEYS